MISIMLRTGLLLFVYSLVVLPVGWVLWHLTGGWPLGARLAMQGAFVLGLADGRRRRRARKAETFRSFVD